MAIKNGEIIEADEIVNNCIGTTFKNQAQLLYNAAYIGFNSKLNVVTGIPNLKNVKYDIMTSDSAFSLSGFSYNSTDDLYQTFMPTEYVIIEATSFGSWTGNNTTVSRFGTGKWIVYCTAGTDAVQRAQIHKSLWYGTNGTDQLILDFTGVTAIKTSNANDVGKRAYYLYAYGHNSGTTQSATLTFLDTTNNTNCSSWSKCYDAGPDGGHSESWQMPIGAILNSGNSDELGTDKTSDEVDNPASCGAYGLGPYNSYGYTDAIVLAYGAVTEGGNATIVNYYVDNLIPEMTEADALSTELIFQTTSLPTITDCIPTWNASIDDDNTLTVSISADGTNYEEVTDATIHRFTNTGTNLYVKFEIDRVDTSAVDKISEYAILYNTGASE